MLSLPLFPFSLSLFICVSIYSFGRGEAWKGRRRSSSVLAPFPSSSLLLPSLPEPLPVFSFGNSANVYSIAHVCKNGSEVCWLRCPFYGQFPFVVLLSPPPLHCPPPSVFLASFPCLPLPSPSCLVVFFFSCSPRRRGLEISFMVTDEKSSAACPQVS